MNIGIWEEFLDIVRQEAGSRVVETWFKAVQLHNWDPELKTVYLQAPNPFIGNWVASKYTHLIQQNLARLLHVNELNVKFMIGAQEKEPEVEAKACYLPVVTAKASTQVAVSSKTTGYLNPQYLFENFVVGPSNSLAYAAAQAVAEKPGTVYNPLFIYGDSGLGKTHLLHAIGNTIKKNNPQPVVLYQTADRFVHEFINAIRFDKVHKFKAKYQTVDVLLIDDAQFLSNKDQTQEAFFHIFNTLHESHKQIVFTSDVIPQDLKGIAERLRSRMGWGLVTDMYTPKLETKIAILKKKAHAHNELLPDDVALFIADTVDSNVRELEGALIRIIAFAALTKQQISITLAEKVLAGKKKLQGKPEFQQVLSAISRHFGYSIQDLQSKSRNRDLAHVRQIAMFLMKKHTDKSLRDIGLYLGGRDHSTVMHAYNKIEDTVTKDALFAKKIRSLEQDLAR